MCNCNKTKKVSAEEIPQTAARSRKMVGTSIPAELRQEVPVSLLSTIKSLPTRFTVENEHGELQRVMVRTHDQMMPLYMKLRLMAKAPRLFNADDPHWQLAGGDERVEQLFQAVQV